MFSQAFFTGIQGGELFVGFAAGSLSSVMSSLWQGGEHFKDNGDFTMSREMVNGIGGANPGTVGTMFFGTISGGAGAAISGGNFWQGAATGLVVSGLNHALHSRDQQEPKPKKYKGSLKSSHGEKVYSLEEWYNAYEDNTYKEITTEAGYKQGLPAGPKMRYVRNPIDGNIMDMRHVSVVGYGMGNNAGDLVEHIQYGTGDSSNSAYDIQDYYSNKTGAYFYQLRNLGSWASGSWAYDFKRFILTQYKALQPAIMANIPKN